MDRYEEWGIEESGGRQETGGIQAMCGDGGESRRGARGGLEATSENGYYKIEFVSAF